jgi:hypothetical protein
LDIDRRIGVGAGATGAADDFQQGCVTVEATGVTEVSPTYALIARFGGNWDSTASFLIRVRTVRGDHHVTRFVP